MKHGDKFKHKSGVIYTLFNLISYKEATMTGGLLSYDIDCWILVSRDSSRDKKHRQWCSVDEGFTALGAFGGHFNEFEKV